MRNIQAFCTLQELMKLLCIPVCELLQIWELISKFNSSICFCLLKCISYPGELIKKLLLTNVNISKHRARQSKLALNTVLENSVFSAWILFEYSLNFMSKNQLGLWVRFRAWRVLILKLYYSVLSAGSWIRYSYFFSMISGLVSWISQVPYLSKTGWS